MVLNAGATEGISSYAYFGTNSRIVVAILKSRLATPDVAGFKAWLAMNNLTILYQLINTVFTNLNMLGSLLSLRSVSFEPFYQCEHQTNALGQITLPYTGNLEAIYGYDESFIEYELDSLEYSLSGNVLVITGALENEVFYVMMLRDYAAPIPQMTVNSINSKTTIKDTTNGKYYELVPTITNGVLVGQSPMEVV